MNGSLICPLCKLQNDSHDHLFFECPFSKKVWDECKGLARLVDAPDILSSVVVFFQSLPSSKSVWYIIKKLMIGAVVYYIWQERNMRIFTKTSRSIDNVVELIKTTIRLKLSGLRMKKSIHVHDVGAIWGFHLQYGVNRKRI